VQHYILVGHVFYFLIIIIIVESEIEQQHEHFTFLYSLTVARCPTYKIKTKNTIINIHQEYVAGQVDISTSDIHLVNGLSIKVALK